MGKGVVDESHPKCLGNASLSSGDYVHRAIEQADVIINVGHDVIEKPPFFMKHGGVEVIHVNFLSATVDPVYFPQVEVVGDVANSIWQLCERLQPQDNWDFSYFEKVKAALDDQLQEGIDDDRFPTLPATDR